MPSEDTISALEWELLAFFEAEPVALEADARWPYNTFIYRTRSGEFDVRFSVAPFYRDFTLIVTLHEKTHIEWSFLGVQDIRYHAAPDERLVIHVADGHVLELRLRPTFSLYGGDRPQT